MKQKLKFKKNKLLIKYLSTLALFSAVVAGTSYGTINNTTNLVTNHSTIVNHDATITNNSQPTLDDVVNGDVSSLSEPIVTTDGNYLLPTLTTGKLPGLIKLNSFVTKLYGINFENFKDYHVRQIVQNYNNQNQYFVLLVNDNASVTANFDATKITFSQITNPGHVIAINDTGSSFNITEDYELNMPILDQTLMTYYMNMRFQQPIGPRQTQDYNGFSSFYSRPWISLNPEYMKIVNNERGANFLSGFSVSSTTDTSLKKLNETWLDYEHRSASAPTPAFSKNVLTFLYLNSLNNMVFVSDKDNNSGSDAIYIFGGNQLINLWFYTFNVNQQNTDSSLPIKEPATAYANYRIWFPDINYDPASTLDSSDIVVQKAYNFNLNISERPSNSVPVPSSWNLNPYKDASFFGYYIAGAKLVNQPTPQIELALTIPNYALFNSNQPVVFSMNVSANMGDKYKQPPQSRIINLYAEISVNTALQTTLDRNQQVSNYNNDSFSWSSDSNWNPRYSNSSYSFMNVLNRDNGILQHNVDPRAFNRNDGYFSKVYNKLVAYVPQILGDNKVFLKYTRDRILVISEADDQEHDYPSSFNFYQPNTSMRNLSNISYSNGIWFLSYKTSSAARPSIYSLSFKSENNESYFVQTNLTLDSNLDVLNILTLKSNYFYILAKDRTTNKMVINLYQAKDPSPSDYEKNDSFSNLMNDSTVPKLMGVPAYSDGKGVQNTDQQALWGTVKFKGIDYLRNNGFLSKTAASLVNDFKMLNDLVEYTPGWAGQDVKVSASADENNQLHLQVSIKYFNGNYYSPQQLSDLNVLSHVYQGFSLVDPPPAAGDSPIDGDPAVTSQSLEIFLATILSISLLGILIGLGLGFGIPLFKVRKLLNKQKVLLPSKESSTNEKLKRIKLLPTSKKLIPIAKKQSVKMIKTIPSKKNIVNKKLLPSKSPTKISEKTN